MNTNIVPFTILDMSKVFLWPHNHLLHWSHMITHVYNQHHMWWYVKNKMKFHMLMLMNSWMMLVLMKCKCQMQCLTLGCYTCHRLTKERTGSASRRLGTPPGQPPLDCLRWPPPLVGGPLARPRVHPCGAFSPEFEFGWSTLCFFGRDAHSAFPDCVFCHVFHNYVLQNMLVPKLVEKCK